jgi:hypothetical protein
MMYDPEDNPRSLHGEIIPDPDAEMDADSVRRELNVLATADRIVRDEGYSYITGTALAAQQEMVKLLRDGGPRADTIEKVQKLRGMIEGIGWVIEFPKRIAKDRAHLESELTRLEAAGAEPPEDEEEFEDATG